MKILLHSALLSLALMFAVSAPAHAQSNPPLRQQAPVPTAPEVDPSMAVVGLSLLGGTLAVVRARRRK